jgi:hypothetical protein
MGFIVSEQCLLFKLNCAAMFNKKIGLFVGTKSRTGDKIKISLLHQLLIPI